MLAELINARQTELQLAGRQIERRMEWDHLSRIDRLERALKVARGKMQFMPNFSARTN